MTFNGQHVLEFSPNGKLFALINDQGILRIWDTETSELKQEFTPNLHLAGPCTAFTWLVVGSGKKTRETKSKKQSNESLYILLGTSNGKVSLYSYALGKIERNLEGEGHSGKITSIVSDNEGNIYTAGEDSQIIVWKLSEEARIMAWSTGDEKPESMVYLPHSKKLVVGGRQIQVYSVVTQELVQTFTGHTSGVNLMTSLSIDESLEFALSASKREQIICLWKIGKKGYNKLPTSTLHFEDSVIFLSCQVNNDGILMVACVTCSGLINIYSLNIESIKTVKPVKPCLTVEIASDSATVLQPISTLAASLQHSKRPHHILIGYGDINVIVFEQLELNFEEKIQVLVRSDPKKLYVTKAAKNRQNISSFLKILRPIVESEDVEYKSSTLIKKKNLKSSELPMESRLQNLNLNSYDGPIKPKAESKAQLLVQALHSKDETLLRSVLSTNDKRTIQLTLEKLPVQYVGPLVNELTLMMQQKHINVEFSMNWLKVLAQTHSSQLLAHGVDDLVNKFGPCIGIIEHRANCLKELSKLSGRLQLLVGQIKRNTEEENLKSENVLVFEDNDSSNSDVEDSAHNPASDGEWEEGDGDGEESEESEVEEMQT